MPLFPEHGLIRNYRVGDWTNLLTKTVFGIECTKDEKFCLTSRTLFGYTIRRQLDGAFRTFDESFTKQARLPQQMALLYFLGLDWTIAQDWLNLVEREKAIRAYESATKNKELEGLVALEKDLRTQLSIERPRLAKMQDNVNFFNILPEYQALQKESDSITRRLREISDQNFESSSRLDNLRESLSSEIVVESDNLGLFIKQVETLFKESVTDRLSKVREFHNSVMTNREKYLKQEIFNVEQRLALNEREQGGLLKRQAEIMQVLKASGGLDQFTKLQREVSKQEAKVELLEKQFKRAQEISLIKAECDERRGRLAHRLILNLSEQEEEVSEAIALYEDISSRLYSASGHLRVGQNESGPQIDIQIAAQRSKGITNMQIFTFDLTAAALMTKRGVGPKCLIHDSHVFDGVDPRQIESALQAAKEICHEYAFQYIVCLTSDQLQNRSAYEDSIVQPVLFDHTEDGGLFGFRFA